MKKIVVTCLICGVIKMSYGQQWTEKSCNNSDAAKEWMRSTDSLGRFLQDLKQASSPEEWGRFQQLASDKAALGAFDAFGVRAEELRRSYSELARLADRNLETFIVQTDPGGMLTDEQLKNKLQAEVQCALDHDPQLSLGGLGIVVLPAGQVAQGPCETAALGCSAATQAAYNEQVMTCVGVAQGVGGMLLKARAGWLAGGLVIVCLSNASEDKYQSLMNCVRNYRHCLDQQ